LKCTAEIFLERSKIMNYFQHYLVDEFVEDYQEKRLSRRDALRIIASITGSLLIAEGILAACAPLPETKVPVAATPVSTATVVQTASTTPEATTSPKSTVPAATPSADMVSPDDPAIEAGAVEFPSDGATIMAYLAHPKQDGSFPVVLVCHENRGLTAYIQDVTRRLAKAGYVGLAVDLLSRQGGTQKVGESNVPGALGGIDPEQFVSDFKNGWAYLKTQPFATAERVGMLGFCFGGGVAWRVAVEMPELKAVVPFYGPPPPESDLPKVKAAVLAIYGELDQRITGTAPAIEATMKANGKVFEKVIYPNADHAFHNDTGSRYNPEAAKSAWARTLEWFGKYL
jgi:carboxymethylenebutenolidase